MDPNHGKGVIRFLFLLPPLLNSRALRFPVHPAFGCLQGFVNWSLSFLIIREQEFFPLPFATPNALGCILFFMFLLFFDKSPF